VLRFIEGLDGRQGERRIIDEAAPLLDGFETAAQRAGVAPVAIKPARYALAMLIDQRARQLRGITLGTWSVLARRTLFEGRDIPMARIRAFRDTARHNGMDDLEAFLGEMLERAETLRAGPQRRHGGGWGWKAAAFALLLVGSLTA